MERAEAIELLEDLDGAIEDNHGRDYDGAFRMAIEALQAQMGGDLISREEVLETIDYRRKTANIDSRIVLDEVEDRIRELSSAEPKTGEWKLVSEELPQSVGSYIVTCKYENGTVYVDYDFWTVFDKFKYNGSKVTAWIPFPKPYCGAKMVANIT